MSCSEDAEKVGAVCSQVVEETAKDSHGPRKDKHKIKFPFKRILGTKDGANTAANTVSQPGASFFHYTTSLLYELNK